jgi:hypothetical protein
MEPDNLSRLQKNKKHEDTQGYDYGEDPEH